MMNHPVYPFAAIVGQDELKLALILTVISPSVSGVLIRGEKGTAKSTAVRGLAQLLPDIEVAGPATYHLSAQEFARYGEELGLAGASDACDAGPSAASTGDAGAAAGGGVTRLPVPLVELPVGATEDRVAGTLDLESALHSGVKRFEPGLLAAAHRGILYVDEVNLLDDHVVDLLLDSAAMGVNTVEREGISLTHPARFSLVGTMNPEEGELRPQLLDRFGLCVNVTGEQDARARVEIVQRRLAFEADPEAFARRWAPESEGLRKRIAAAMELIDAVTVTDAFLLRVAQVAIDAGVDGHRADIMMVRCARALAAWEGRTELVDEDLQRAASLVLLHRMRRSPLDAIRG
ncbi:magnesium chelatase [Corynebacterium atypicum]|uniref:Mg-protoporphyrin IX chelatase n=1 Tax=Corynebacterium atypicum TaxID=191610 RepID=A0ABM5QKZ2_9CORY|nr:ATP-binding protein [Corynebacterium atypicum]AIG63454.1 magnesium chelatase [Corynebacterium atypicum]